MSYHLTRFVLWLNRAGEDNHIKAGAVILMLVLVPVYFFTRDARVCAEVCELIP